MGLSLAFTLAFASSFVRRRGPVLGLILALAFAFLAFAEAEVVVWFFTFSTLLALAAALLAVLWQSRRLCDPGGSRWHELDRLFCRSRTLSPCLLVSL